MLINGLQLIITESVNKGVWLVNVPIERWTSIKIISTEWNAS